jgi:acetyltransferase-like isoleucine patch superfamily enzyme
MGKPGTSFEPSGELPADARVGAFVLFDARPESPEGEALPPTRLGPGALLRSHTVIYAGNVIGARFQTGHGVLVRERNSIGDDVSIGSHSVVEHHVTLADRVRIHSAAFIPEHSVLEEGVWIGPNVVFTNARYPNSPSAKSELRGPHLFAHAKVGAGAVLLPGVTIGAGALVGAGAVVVKDVPAHAVVLGNPARVVGDVRDRPAYRQRLQT